MTSLPEIIFFSIPKAFSGRFETIQNNAIQSWRKSGSAAQIILFGDDGGIAEAARRFSAFHVPDVRKNEFGTPLIDDVFEKAERIAGAGLLCYINTDILVRQDLRPIAGRIPFEHYLAVGRRSDMDFEEALDFERPDWQETLAKKAEGRTKLHSFTGIDYFLFTRGLYRQIPPFAVGRTAWDNWLIFEARRNRVPVIDLTETFRILHQNHDYPEGLKQKGRWKGKEAEKNLELAGDLDFCFSIRDADWEMRGEGPVRKPAWPRLVSEVWHVPALYATHPAAGPAMRAILAARRSLRRVFRRLREGAAGA